MPSRPPIGWQKGREKRQKLPKNAKNSRNETFSITATVNVCLKDTYTVDLKKKSLIHDYRTLCDLLSDCPSAILFKLCDLVSKLNFWSGARGRDSTKTPKILHQYICIHIGWLRLVGSLKVQVSFAKEPYKRDYLLQKRPIILRSLLIIATP